MMLVLSGGCSFIWGAELSDSLDYSGQDPFSKLTWPALWAKSHGFDYDTAAQCGISNMGISRKIIDYIEHVKIPDFVIVQWTYPNRFELRFDDLVQGNYFTMNHWLMFLDEVSEVKNQKVAYELSLFKDTIFQRLAEIWYSHIANQDSEYFYFLKEAVFLGNYLRNKNINFCFAHTLKNGYPSNVTDTSIQSLENQASQMAWIDFDRSGFIEWAEKNRYFDRQHWKHPDESAHLHAFKIIKDDLNHIFNIER